MEALKAKFTKMVGTEQAFTYNDKPRKVMVEQLKECGNGNVVLVCKQLDDGKYKSFNINTIVM